MNIKTVWDLQRQKQPGAKVCKRTVVSSPGLLEKPTKLSFLRNIYYFCIIIPVALGPQGPAILMGTSVFSGFPNALKH